ncbi:peptide ABC transporter substrate-binding protein [Candidatus Bipolaricaulota bacterium]|nr:peptide ABC transporter substrate-binding protein [Candidatus Bipolaricaulota bacterium]
MHKIGVVFLLVVLVGVVVWGGPDQNNIVIGATQEPDQLNPWEGAADTKENVMALFFIGLTYFDTEGNLLPGLATEIPSAANGRLRIVRDAAGNFVRQEVDWTIRDDAFWSDGVPITTADVLFTLEVQNHPLIPVTFRTFSAIIEEIKVRDDKNFTIVYKEPNLFYASPTGRIGLARFYDIAPKHIWEPIFREAIAEAEANPAKAAEIIMAKFLGADPASGRDPTKVVGSGPFKFAEWQRNQFIRGVRRTDFFLFDPKVYGPAENYVKEVIVRFIVHEPTLLAALFAGELDASDDIGLAGQDPEVLRSRGQGVFTVEVSPSGFIEQLNFNNFGHPRYGDEGCQIARDLLLHDPRTRQAIIQAIDREPLAKAVFPGAIVSNSFVVRGDFGFNPDLNPWPYDPEASRKLLAELGWKDTDGNGVLDRVTPDGRKVEFRLPHATTPASFRVRTQELLQEYLSDVGIKLEPVNYPASVLFSTEFVNGGSACTWPGIIEFASAGGLGEVPADELSGELWGDDPRTPELWDNVPRRANAFAGSNVTGWINDEYDRLHFAALSEFDLDQRAHIIREMQVIFNEELPFVPLYERVEILTVKVGLVNYVKGTAVTRTPFWNAWEWGWKQHGAVQLRSAG